MPLTQRIIQITLTITNKKRLLTTKERVNVFNNILIYQTKRLAAKERKLMREHLSLEKLFKHPIVQKYVYRSGMAHAIAVAENAFEIAISNNVNPILAAKAGFLHDIGHYEWYRLDGKWDYETYKKNDIHAIKGAARAHKLLVRCGEDLQDAKQIALAILLHTDSYLPEGQLELSPLQKVVAKADTMDEELGGKHHYRKIDSTSALARIRMLDSKINNYLLGGLEQTS